MTDAHSKFLEKLQLVEYEAEEGKPPVNTLDSPLKGDIAGIPYIVEYVSALALNR